MEQDFYLNKLLKLKDNFSVKIITGVRGVGKTTLLKNFAENLRAAGVADKEIIFIDCAEVFRPRNFQQLYEFVDATTVELDKFFLLIDEIDRVEEWEKAINALFVGTPAEIYVTGSRESLAENISALLPENCDVLKMHPLSFAEYKEIYCAEDALQNYLYFGGMPAAIDVDKKFLPKVLRGIFYEMLCDIVEKNSLSDISSFRLLIKFLAQGDDSVSVNEYFRRLGENNFTKIRNYLGIVQEFGLFKKILRFDIKAEKFIKGGEKFYCIDNGILSALAEVDEKTLMENAVYNELLRRGFNVGVGKFGAMNITFVAEKGGEKLFIQVLPPDGSITPRRLTRPLRALPEGSKKILISMNRLKNFGDVESITLRDFLLET